MKCVERLCFHKNKKKFFPFSSYFESVVFCTCNFLTGSEMGLHECHNGAAWSQLTYSNSHEVLVHLWLPEHLIELLCRKWKQLKDWWRQQMINEHSKELHTLIPQNCSLSGKKKDCLSNWFAGKKASGCGSTNWHLAAWGDINFRSRFPGAAKINAKLPWHSDWFFLQWLGVYNVTGWATQRD